MLKKTKKQFITTLLVLALTIPSSLIFFNQTASAKVVGNDCYVRLQRCTFWGNLKLNCSDDFTPDNCTVYHCESCTFNDDPVVD